MVKTFFKAETCSTSNFKWENDRWANRSVNQYRVSERGGGNAEPTMGKQIRLSGAEADSTCASPDSPSSPESDRRVEVGGQTQVISMFVTCTTQMHRYMCLSWDCWVSKQPTHSAFEKLNKWRPISQRHKQSICEELYAINTSVSGKTTHGTMPLGNSLLIV